jgi:hypothetical protein
MLLIYSHSTLHITTCNSLLVTSRLSKDCRFHRKELGRSFYGLFVNKFRWRIINTDCELRTLPLESIRTLLLQRSNVAAQWLAFLLHIREVQDSLWLSQSFPVNVGISQIRPVLFPSVSLPFHYS